MKIPVQPHRQQIQQPGFSLSCVSSDEEEDDFSSSLSYCSSYPHHQQYLSRKGSFCNDGLQQQRCEEEGKNVIWCDICKQEGFEETATHYCSTCFKEHHSNTKNGCDFIVQDEISAVEQQTIEEEGDEESSPICHYCQYHANRHSRRDPLHQIVSIRQATFPSDLLRSGSFVSSTSSFGSEMSSISPLLFPTSSSTSTGPTTHPLFNFNSSNNNLMSAGIRYCFKHEEAIPLNTYCRTCELVICSQCALSKAHKGHVIELIKDVENSERVQLGEHVKILKQSFEEWEEEFSVYDEDLEEEIKHIDQREESLTMDINAAFDELKDRLEKRRTLLLEEVEQSCHENKQSIHNILKMKKESKELISEFDHLDNMSGFEVIDKKLNRLNLVIVLYEKMQKEFKTRKLSDLHQVSLDKFTSRKNIIQHNIDELGTVENKSTTTKDTSPPISIPFNFKHVETIGSVSNNNKHVQFSFPSDVKISYQHSCILVADFGNKNIRVLDLTSRQLKYNIETVSAPRNISIDHTDDDSIIVSCADHCVYKYSLLNHGKSIVWRSGVPNESGNSETLFKYPRASIVDEEGNIHVCDHGNHRIKVLRSSDGQVITTIGNQEDEVQFKRPWGIWIDKGGNLVVTEKKNNRMQRISKLGDTSLFLLGKKGNSQHEFNKPRGVLVDTHNENVFICDGGNHRIQVFSKVGKLIKSFGSEGSKSSQLSQPHSMCFDILSGQLLVADCGNHRIQVFL